MTLKISRLLFVMFVYLQLNGINCNILDNKEIAVKAFNQNIAVKSWYHILNSEQNQVRFKRNIPQYNGKLQGQTQSQYLSFGSGNTPGKAEAEATVGSSKAVVSGSNGIGSAQSQSSSGSCEDCFRDRFSQEQSLYYGKGSHATTDNREPIKPTVYGSVYPDFNNIPASQRQRPGAPSYSPGLSGQQGPYQSGLPPAGQVVDQPQQGNGRTGEIPSQGKTFDKSGMFYPYGYPGGQPQGVSLPGQQPGFTQFPEPSQLPGQLPGQGQAPFPQGISGPSYGRNQLGISPRVSYPHQESQSYPAQGQSYYQPVDYPQSPYFIGQVPAGPAVKPQEIIGQPQVNTFQQGTPGSGYERIPSGVQYPSSQTGQQYYPEKQIPGQYVKPSILQQPYLPQQQVRTEQSGSGQVSSGNIADEGSGKFSGNVAGMYQPNQGTSGRFSGTFSGTYSHERGTQQIGTGFNYPIGSQGYTGQGGHVGGTPGGESKILTPSLQQQWPAQNIYSGGQSRPIGQTGSSGDIGTTGRIGGSYPKSDYYGNAQQLIPSDLARHPSQFPGVTSGTVVGATGIPGYPTGSAVQTGIPGYPTGSAVQTGISGYPTGSAVETGISGYPTGSAVQTGIPGYPTGSAVQTGISGYPTGSAVQTGISGYPTGSADQTGHGQLISGEFQNRGPSSIFHPSGGVFPSSGQPIAPSGQPGVQYPQPHGGISAGQPGQGFPAGIPVQLGGPQTAQSGVPYSQQQPGFIPQQPGYGFPQTSENVGPTVTGQVSVPIGGPVLPAGYPTGYPTGGTSGQGEQKLPGGGYTYGGYPGSSGAPVSGQGAIGGVSVPSEISLPPSKDESDANSQAQADVFQVNGTTEAKAESQGYYAGGTAQSQVSGSYSGSGSFSASAGTIDGKRGTQTKVSGGKEGATSNAQGSGGAGLSQAQVSLLSETGETASSAHSSGLYHGTNTQVQAGSKGGLADAQANGPGSTSSQAQIGFTPHNEQERNENENSPFLGGGSANAQSGSYAGQSQSRLQGKFLYGIKYSGNAQAGSGNTNLTQNRSNVLDLSNAFSTNKTLSFSAEKSEKTFDNNVHKILEEESIRNIPHAENEDQLMQKKTYKPHKQFTSTTTTTTTTESPTTTITNPSLFYNRSEDYDEDYDYEEEVQDSPYGRAVITQTGRTQRQNIILDPLEDLDANVIQSRGDYPDLPLGSVIQPGEDIPGSYGYRIPSGFRGRVTSIANDSAAIALGKNSQAQSVSLKPGTGNIVYNEQPTYAVGFNTQLKSGGRVGIGSGYTYQPVGYRLRSSDSPPSFISVTKSESGSKDLNTGVKKPNIFYTQSSTCGFFTNTCVVRGNRRICIPKPKTNPDGSPLVC